MSPTVVSWESIHLQWWSDGNRCKGVVVKIAIVTPTVRPERLGGFVEAWQQLGAEFFFVHDSATVPAHSLYHHYSWSEIEHETWGWIIPRRAAAIRSYGIYKAWESGAEVIVCLDDDVYPTTPGHLDRLVSALNRTWQTDWVYPHPQGARGLPYQLNREPTWLHMGAWNSNPDLDGAHRLVLGEKVTNIKTIDDKAVPPGQFLVLSAMHFAFRRELAPAAYHLLMGGGPWGNEWNMHRFDDVWAGMFMKKICDHLGVVMSFGGPLCEHRQASDPMNNMVAEAEGIREHEKRWRDIAHLPVSGDCVKCCYESIAKAVQLWGGYWGKLGHAMGVWANLFPCTASDKHGVEIAIRPGVVQFVGERP